MDVDGVIKYTLNTNDFINWEKTYVKKRFKNHLYVCITNKCNLNCEPCCGQFQITKNDYEYIDLDKFKKFFEMFLIDLKYNYDHMFLVLSGGEFTLMKPKFLLEFLLIVITLSKQYNISLNIVPLTNLIGLKDWHFEYFKLLKNNNKKSGWNFFIKTSTDYYHFPDGDFSKHIDNIKKINNLDIPVVVTFLVSGKDNEKDEILSIQEKYKNLNVSYKYSMITDLLDLDNQYLIIKRFLKAYYEDKEFYKYIFNYKFGFYICYNWNNNLITNAITPTKIDLQVSLDNIKSIYDVYQQPLFLWSEYIQTYYKHKYPNLIIGSSTVHYYKKYIKKMSNITKELEFIR